MNALELFRSGLDTSEIEARLGVTEAQAYKMINDALDEEYRERQEWRTANAQRLQEALEAV